MKKLVSGSGFRAAIKEPTRCEQCDVLELSLNKSKETIRSLRLQLSRLEALPLAPLPARPTSLANLGSDQSGQLVNSAADSPSTQPGDELLKEYNVLLNRNRDYENEITRMRKAIADLQTASRTAIHTQQEALVKAQRETIGLHDSVVRLEAEAAALEADKMALRAALQDKEAALEQTQQLRRESVRFQDMKIAELTEQLATEEAKSRAQGAQVTSLTAQLQVRDEAVAKLQTTSVLKQRELEAAQASLVLANNRLRETVDMEEAARMRENEALDKLRAREKAEKEDQAEMAKLKRENELLSGRHNELLQRMIRESENTALALERALTSTIRLCVVAPTVNVSVQDKKLKFKSSVPEDALREFLLRDVLDKYTFLFQQPADNVGPDGKPIQPWVERILGEMQRTIDVHINTAILDSASKSNSF